MKLKALVIANLLCVSGLVAGAAFAWKCRLEKVAVARDRTVMQLRKELADVRHDLDRARAALAEANPDAKKSEPEEEKRPPLAVESVEFDEPGTLTLRFNCYPDEEMLKSYVSITPALAPLGVAVYRSRVKLTGNFPFDVPVTVRIRAGLPAHDVPNTPPLAKDFTYTFRRPDLPPMVTFADRGRYLPPDGRRLVALNAVNVTNAFCSVARVPAANVVQLLAREECCYEFGNAEADTERTTELADTAREWKLPARGPRNVLHTLALPLVAAGAAPSNGIFLVTVRSADTPRKDYARSWVEPAEKALPVNRNSYRLVCVTDLGLTVRHADRKLHVWVTSLCGAKPVARCRLAAYSSANVRLATAVTDASGLATLTCAGEAEPFVVTAESADGGDLAFMALSERAQVEETGVAELSRDRYLAPDAFTAFAWTERGIYRHDENIFFHALLRNGRGVAPKPFPVDVRLIGPDDRVSRRLTCMPDASGSLCCTNFAIAADSPSGTWRITVAAPGTDPDDPPAGGVSFAVEEFAPPQIRVQVTPAGDTPATFAFGVSAEHLFGGPAAHLRAEGAVVFTDAPFAPPAWKGYRFGDEGRGLKPNFRRLAKCFLNAEGQAEFAAPLLKDTGLPRAAVRAVAQGTVFEDGGRPATMRAEKILHAYPYYIGVAMDGTVTLPKQGFPSVRVACVRPDGTRLPEARQLEVSILRINCVYSCKCNGDDEWNSWSCERVRVPCVEPFTVTTASNADAVVSLPLHDGGDYAILLRDPKTDVTYGGTFWLSAGGDGEVRAPLANPAAITLACDKTFYRPGERPRLVVKAPFTGLARLTLTHTNVLWDTVLDLTNATTEVVLPAVAAAWAPNADVSVSVVRGARAAGREPAIRAHGACVLAVRPSEREFPVEIKTSVVCGPNGGSVLTADVVARAASATGTVAMVTVVDEGINLLTGEEVPDPVGYFAQPREGYHPLYDLFGNLLPVWDGDPAKVRGVKTGGGLGEGLLGRVSPVPTRRFKPLAKWQAAVPLVDGHARVTFNLPEFAGEVRVTAVAWSDRATGAGAVRQKVVPNLILQADAPRFAAPGDDFTATITLIDRTGRAAEAEWSVVAEGSLRLARPLNGRVRLAPSATTNIFFNVLAGDVPGEGRIRYRVAGSGERHEQILELPVRPAVASRTTAGVSTLKPGGRETFALPASTQCPEAAVRTFTALASPQATLAPALAFLADYPHGCLEQTVSRIFPLLASGGALTTLLPENPAVPDRRVYVNAGVRRVVSMMREDHFVMWPDCTYEPPDREVSLYAAHFLVAADNAQVPLAASAKGRVLNWLRHRAVSSTNSAVAAYACHTLALAGKPERDRMLRLYDARGTLRPIDRARLAGAFVSTGDRKLAETLLKDGVAVPASVKEAAFVVLALLDLDPNDARLPELVAYLTAHRVPAQLSWGTTGENAHALMALAAYYRHHPMAKDGVAALTCAAGAKTAAPLVPRKTQVVRGGAAVTVANTGTGTGWLAWQRTEIPKALSVTNESCGLSVACRYRTPEGEIVDWNKIARGDLVLAEIAITSATSRPLADLVVQQLLPAAFEPVHAPPDTALFPWFKPDAHAWVMRAERRDDRLLVFSKAFRLKAGEEAVYVCPLRVVSAGTFILPGPTVEAMYMPALRAVAAPQKLTVR